jgi:hypothetical protein
VKQTRAWINLLTLAFCTTAGAGENPIRLFGLRQSHGAAMRRACLGSQHQGPTPWREVIIQIEKAHHS